MTEDLMIIIIDNNETTREEIVDELTKNDYHILQAANGVTALNLIKKNQVNLALVELSLPDVSGVTLIEKINEISPSTEFLIISEKITMKNMKYLLTSNIKFGYLEKPIDFKILNMGIKKMIRSKEEFFEIQNTLNDMFESYNHLEFLMTVLLNDYESSTESLKKALESINMEQLTEEQLKHINIIRQVYYNNNRLISSYNNLRSVSDISPKEFAKQDIVLIIKEILDELQLKTKCQLQLPNDFKSGKFFIKGTFEGIKVLFLEIFKALTIPETNLCKNLDISIKNSDENLLNAYAIEIKTILHKIEDVYHDSILDPSTYQYGFSYFVIRNLVETFDGKLLLSDTKKDDLTETKMVVVLPKY